MAGHPEHLPGSTPEPSSSPASILGQETILQKTIEGVTETPADISIGMFDPLLGKGGGGKGSPKAPGH